MNNTFSFYRILLLLRIDWIEQRKGLLLTLVSVIAIIIVFVWILKSDSIRNNLGGQEFLYRLGLLLTINYLGRFIRKNVHNTKGPYLTLPANTLEKYCVLLFEGLSLFLLFHLLFWGSLYICSILFPSYPIIQIQALYNTSTPAKEFTPFLISLFFLAYMSFRKFASPITVAGLFLVGASYAAVISYLVNKVDYFDNMPPFIFNPLTGLGTFFVDNLKYITYTASLIFLYISYLKLKEKEVR